MGEMHIRINKRVFERTLFIIIILALLVALFLQYNKEATASPDVDVSALETQIQDLQNERDTLQAQLDAQKDAETLEAEAEAERNEALGEELEETETEVTEPEPVEEELSGEISVSWTVRSEDDMLDYVRINVENGLEKTQALDYLLYWDSLDENVVKREGDFVVKSGDAYAEVFIRDGVWDGDSLPRTHTTVDSDELVLEIRNEDGDLIDKLTSNVP